MRPHALALLTLLAIAGAARADDAMPKWDLGPNLTPFFGPLTNRLCFPLMRSASLDAALVDAQNDGFVRFGGDAQQALMRHDTVMLALTAKSCTILLTKPLADSFIKLTTLMMPWLLAVVVES